MNAPLEFSVGDGGDHPHVVETYTRPIFEAARPYAIVEARGEDLYAVTSADSNEQAMVTWDARLQAGAIGLRLYLRSVFGFSQVHVENAGPWPSHEQCLAIQEWRRVELDCAAAIPPWRPNATR